MTVLFSFDRAIGVFYPPKLTLSEENAPMSSQLLLASGSPRRKMLLEELGITIRAVPSNIPEVLQQDEDPVHYAKRMAREKVLAVARRTESTLYLDPEGVPRSSYGSGNDSVRWVLGADTIVVLDGEVFEKPKDNHDAYNMLTRLSGNEHEVITAFCVLDLLKSKEGLQAVHTKVQFKHLSKIEIEKYVALGEGTDKAGSYGVQGVGSYLVESIHGSYTNVVGLPLCQVVEMLQEMGASEVLPF